MSAYITALSLANIFGKDEVAAWSSQDNVAVCSGNSFIIACSDNPDFGDDDSEESIALEAVSRCNMCINYASIEIDNILNNIYDLPLEQTVIDNSILPIICAHITRYHLCDTNITADISDKAIWARKQLKEIALGVIVITKNIAVPAMKCSYNHFEKFMIY